MFLHILLHVQINNAHAIGVTAVSWAPAVPAGALVASQPPSTVTKRLCTAGCDNTVKVSRTALVYVRHMNSSD